MRTLIPLLATILYAIVYYKPPSATADKPPPQEISLNYSTIYRIVLSNKCFYYDTNCTKVGEVKTHKVNFKAEKGKESSLSIIRDEKTSPYRYEWNGLNKKLYNYVRDNDVLVYYFAFVEEGFIIKFEYLNNIKQMHTFTHNVTGRVTKMSFENTDAIVSASYLPERRIRHFLNSGTWEQDLPTRDGRDLVSSRKSSKFRDETSRARLVSR